MQTEKRITTPSRLVYAFIALLFLTGKLLYADSDMFANATLYVPTGNYPGDPLIRRIDLSKYSDNKIDEIILSVGGNAGSQSSIWTDYGMQWYPDTVEMTLSASIGDYRYSSQTTDPGGTGGAALVILQGLRCDSEGIWWAQEVHFSGSPPAPGYSDSSPPGPCRLGVNPLEFSACASVRIYPTGYGYTQTSAGAYVSGIIYFSRPPDPTATLDLPAQCGVGQEINFSLSVKAPEDIANYFTGFVLLEKREDSSGNVIPGWNWIEAKAQPPVTGVVNHNLNITRPAMDRVGKVKYKLCPYNQKMTTEERWAVMPCEREISIINTPPSSAALSLSKTTIEYGESVGVTGNLKDSNGDLKGHSLWVIAPTASGEKNPAWDCYIRALNPDWWGDPRISEAGWSGPWNMGWPSNTSNSTVTGTFTPSRVGVWQLHTNGYDTSGAWGPGDTKDLNVIKATPVGSYAPQSISAYNPLTANLLCAVFKNNHLLNSSVPLTAGTITYTLNGNDVPIGQTLPSGSYTLRATYAGDANHKPASVETTLSVIDNPYADDDNDGVPNGIEAKLGTSPGSPGVMDRNALEIKILTPISTED